MKQVLLIAAAEWRYWLRSYLVLGCAVGFALLLIATSVLTIVRMEQQHHVREHHQNEAQKTFLSQPDRHPHRMVHYGHYVFRSPAPLALFDPGLDPVTGQSIFLEGHRQNSAMFADSGASADLGGFSWLTPALIYQYFAPLLIVMLGHGGIVREREAGVLVPLLVQGIGGRVLMAGKLLALLSFVALLLVPLLVSGGLALAAGESLVAIIVLLMSYFSYLAIWCLITLLVSALLVKRTNVLAALLAVWLCFTLVLPSIAVSLASRSSPVAGKIATDLTMLADLRKLGDGHDANAPAFRQLRADLLEQYDVERIEDLPINFRGVVALQGEQQLTEVLNQYAEQRMVGEVRQAQWLAQFGWLTPTLAITVVSRIIAATDLEHHHRFLREAEALRFEFVQGLNRAHQEKLSYEDDINRNKDEESWRRARVDSSNWQVLDSFRFQPATTSQRLTTARASIGMLVIWSVAMVMVFLWSGGRLRS